MGNYLCGEYVILNAEVPKNNRNDNSDVSASQSRDALVPDGGAGAGGFSKLIGSSRYSKFRVPLCVSGEGMARLRTQFRAILKV